MTLRDLAKGTGKSPPFLMTLISRHGLTRTTTFSHGYMVLLRKLISLSLCSLSRADIDLLLTRERTLLQLLKVDTQNGQATWFEDLCVTASGPTRLLMTGYDLGHPVSANGIQTSLDFSHRETELFSNREMGADALRALRLYLETYESLSSRLEQESRVLASSLRWVRRVCRDRIALTEHPVGTMGQH